MTTWFLTYRIWHLSMIGESMGNPKSLGRYKMNPVVVKNKRIKRMPIRIMYAIMNEQLLLIYICP